MNRTAALLFTGLILGLGWAIRGHFGHEWGAAWAGTLGGLAVLFASKRKDWWDHAPVLGLLSGVGWAVGGMMSYGIVIGYCKGTDFGNVLYGYTMLAVIGGLYGCIGGGMLGLGLASHPEKRPQWAALFTEMVAGAWIFWGFLIYQVELFMTPPRSELWAACLGAAVALLWHLHRNEFHNAFRVAVFSALGAGFGFAFGNFIQTLGIVSGVNYNWWNVMEFTLGFCGGIGMTYAITTSSWPNKGKPSKPGNIAAILTVFLFIPLINFSFAFTEKKLTRIAESVNITALESFISLQQNWGLALVILLTILSVYLWLNKKTQGSRLHMSYILYSLTLFYLLFGFIVKGIFYLPFDLHNSSLSYPVILLIAVGIGWKNRNDSDSFFVAEKQESWNQGMALLGMLMAVLVVIAFISIHSHDGIGNFHERF